MYKIYIKYFGELVDEVSGVDGSGDCAENYELGEEYYLEDKIQLKEKIQELLKNGIEKDFIIDEETDFNIDEIIDLVDNDIEIIRLFFGKQENWNCYYEIIISKNREDF